MRYDLLAMNLSGFNVRKVPRTAAKAHQQALSLPSMEAWLYQVLQEGALEHRAQNGMPGVKHEWQKNGLVVGKDLAYAAYEGFSSRNRDYRPAGKSHWSKRLHAILTPYLATTRIAGDAGRTRAFQFGPLQDCRERFAAEMGADFEWEPDYSPQPTQANDCPPDGNPAPKSKSTQARTAHEAAAASGAIKPSDVAAIAKSVAAADHFVAGRRS
jgi:hypothetical protein